MEVLSLWWLSLALRMKQKEPLKSWLQRKAYNWDTGSESFKQQILLLLLYNVLVSFLKINAPSAQSFHSLLFLVSPLSKKWQNGAFLVVICLKTKNKKLPIILDVKN